MNEEFWVFTRFFFFFNDTATTEIYTLSLHDALPIYLRERSSDGVVDGPESHDTADLPIAGRERRRRHRGGLGRDRKSTRLNSSHANISYAVFCLKKKKIQYNTNSQPQTLPSSPAHTT